MKVQGEERLYNWFAERPLALEELKTRLSLDAQQIPTP